MRSSTTLTAAALAAFLFTGFSFAQSFSAPPQADADEMPSEGPAPAAPAEMAPAETSSMDPAPAEEAPAETSQSYASAGTRPIMGGAAAEEAPAAEAPGFMDRLQYIGVMGAYTFADSDRDELCDGGESSPSALAGQCIKDAYGASVLWGMQWEGALGFELHLFGDILETNAANYHDYYRSAVGLDAVYSFGDRTSMTPFILAGGGGAYNDVTPDDRDEFGWFANAGVGVVTGPLSKNGVGVRAEARAIYDPFEEETIDYRAGVGIEVPLFGEPVVPAPGADRVQVVEVTKEVSTGLYDADGDGVVDGSDKCPDTPAGTRVDGDGCPLPQVIQLKGVTFEFNQDRLTANAKTVLNELVLPLMNRYPDMVVEVAGHTDWVGSDWYNEDLSNRRAASVRTYLTEQGVAGDRMTSKGYGEKEPIATNDTDEGRELNRRVELRIKN